MLRLKEKAEPEAIDAITVCDDLKREGKLEEAGGAGLRPLAAHAGARRSTPCATTRKIVRDHSILRRLLATRARDPGAA